MKGFQGCKRHFVPGSRAIFLVNCSAAFSMPRGPAGPAPSAAPAGLASCRARCVARCRPLQQGRPSGCALGRQRYRQPLSDFLADELLLHLVELSLDLRQQGDVARANPALPPGLTLLAERLAALLLALLGHCGSGAAGRALVAKLEPKLLGTE